MVPSLNPLDHPIMFRFPARLTSVPSWQEHIPFGMLLVDLIRPGIIVELGTHTGVSYCAFCQAIREIGTQTCCYAVDTWQGDDHAGSYGDDVLQDLQAHHDPLYGEFSRLLRCTFDQALPKFEDGSVDLLHIDGLHTYEAVRHDFETWLPKISRSGVVLIHDTAVFDRGFGVHRLWKEVSASYPSFEFTHCNGLGVLAIGPDQTEALQSFLAAAQEHPETVRRFFEQLGAYVALRSVRQEAEALRLEADALRQKTDALQGVLEGIANSRSWKLATRLQRLARLLRPQST